MRVANGQQLTCTEVVPQLKWHTHGHEFCTDMRVLDLGVYDVVLGVDWLACHSPMQCDWGLKTMRFTKQGNMILLTGVRTEDQPAITALDAASLWQMQEENEIWGAALLEIHSQPPDSSGQPVPPIIQQVLTDFRDVFAEPTELPPHRQYDHAISLEPGAAPINSRPYRYSPLQKDEIEKQVAEMLEAGLITPSGSPFASPVLLIKKKDDTWRLCID